MSGDSVTRAGDKVLGHRDRRGREAGTAARPVLLRRLLATSAPAMLLLATLSGLPNTAYGVEAPGSPEAPRRAAGAPSAAHAATPAAPSLLTSGENPSSATRRLERALDARDLAAFEAAIAAGADWRDAGIPDDGVLTLASAFDAEATIRTLVARAVAVDARNSAGETPLFAAAAAGAVHATTALLQLGADASLVVSSRRAPAWTPLFAAAADGHAEVVTLLLAASNVDATDRYGRTPLMYAAMHGQSAVIALLLEAGASPGIRDGDGRSAEDIATLLGRTDDAFALRRGRQ